MNIHEYQAKDLLREFNIPVIDGAPAKSPHEAYEVAQRLGGNLWMVKAQIHAGGRGKAGGIKMAKNLGEVHDFSSEILGKNLVTHQTGPQGKKVHSVLVEKTGDFLQEFYLSLSLDKKTSRLTFIASSVGGMEIEKILLESPEKIIEVSLDATYCELPPFVGRKLCSSMGIKGVLIAKASKIFQNLYKLYTQYEATFIEINPLILTKEGEFFVLDSKMQFDDDALFRQKKIESLRDLSEGSLEEKMACTHGFDYIPLSGNIGVFVNGAALTMATMDLIKIHGGSPANFLDIGGRATVETIEKSFELLLNEKKVKAIFVNIFGGLTRCDDVAKGMISAIKNFKEQLPFIAVRFEGTNYALGRALIEESNLTLKLISDMNEGALLCIKALKEGA